MVWVAVILGFALPPALLVAGLMSLGMAMPSARDTLARWGWIAPATIALIIPAVLVLLFLLAWRGDGADSAWASGDAKTRAASVAAFALAVPAAAVQWWVMLRGEGVLAGRTRSAGAAVGGAAMLALCAALILAWLAGLR